MIKSSLFFYYLIYSIIYQLNVSIFLFMRSLYNFIQNITFVSLSKHNQID